MPSPLRSALQLLKHLTSRPSARSPRDPQPSDETLWFGHVANPAARFRIDNTGNEFVIERDALSVELRKQIDERGPDMRFEVHQIMTDWSDPRHAQDGLIADLPYRWRSFGSIALDLIERGQGYCLCRTCRQVFPAAELRVTRFSTGQEYVTHSTQVLCPASHVLMRSEAHFRVRVSKPERFSSVELPSSSKRG
jgi:hypothetical protein